MRTPAIVTSDTTIGENCHRQHRDTKTCKEVRGGCVTVDGELTQRCYVTVYCEGGAIQSGEEVVLDAGSDEGVLSCRQESCVLLCWGWVVRVCRNVGVVSSHHLPGLAPG